MTESVAGQLERPQFVATDETLHGIVRRLAERWPDRPAVVDGDESLTYGELDAAADAYADALRGVGVAPADLVPVLLPRSAELVVVILGLLKAGAAYALLDERWPAERCRDVFSEIGARVVVSSSDRADDAGVTVWRPPGHTTVRRPAGFEPVMVPSGQVCCGFFSSGTTGRPKIALSPHKATVRLYTPEPPACLGPGTVMPLAAALPWDGFTLELWSALLNGGTTVVIRDQHLTPATLRRVVRDNGVNTVFLSSALLTVFIDEDLEAFEGVEQVLTGGERVSPPHVERFLRRFPDSAVINAYGPVEATVCVSTHRVTLADCSRPTGIPIGRPMARTMVYILDGVRPCGPGEPGEICIGGDGLALGYVGPPETGADKFCTVTVDGSPVRLYRTGDLGVRDNDGLLHYLGRNDRQIKVRGQRVEPAEVERWLERLLAVRRCVVLPRRDDGGRCIGLAAFCVPTTDGDQLGDAQAVLRRAMVPHQVPDMVVSVPDYPLTANGKVDESALLGLLAQRSQGRGGPGVSDHLDSSDRPQEPGVPADPLTALVAGVFADVLGMPRVPPDASLDELGGNSLLGFRVCARLSTRLGRPVSIGALLEHRSAASLADWVRSHPDNGEPEVAPVSIPHEDVPLSPVEAGFLAGHLQDPTDRSSHCLAFWLIEGPLDEGRLTAAISAAHRRHESLRSAYRDGDPPTSRAVDVPPPTTVRLAPARTVEQAVEALRTELGDPLDITAGQVWRVALVPLPGRRSVFGYVVHHIAYDGWSEGVLARDLAAAYRGEQSALPSAPTRAQIWATRRRHRASADTVGQLAELADDLRGAPRLVFPGTPLGKTGDLPGRIERTLDRSTVAGIARRAERDGVRPFAVLLAAYVRATALCTGQDDVTVATPIAQRVAEDLEQAVGCFVGMTLIRVSQRAAGADPATVGPLIERSLAYQHVEYEELIAELRPDRSRGPAFRSTLVFHNNVPPELDLPGCTSAFLRQPYLGIPNDLQTEVWPRPDGALLIVVNHRRAAVADDFALRFADTFAALVSNEGRDE